MTATLLEPGGATIAMYFLQLCFLLTFYTRGSISREFPIPVSTKAPTIATQVTAATRTSHSVDSFQFRLYATTESHSHFARQTSGQDIETTSAPVTWPTSAPVTWPTSAPVTWPTSAPVTWPTSAPVTITAAVDNNGTFPLEIVSTLSDGQSLETSSDDVLPKTEITSSASAVSSAELRSADFATVGGSSAHAEGQSPNGELEIPTDSGITGSAASMKATSASALGIAQITSDELVSLNSSTIVAELARTDESLPSEVYRTQLVSTESTLLTANDQVYDKEPTIATSIRSASEIKATTTPLTEVPLALADYLWSAIIQRTDAALLAMSSHTTHSSAIVSSLEQDSRSTSNVENIEIIEMEVKVGEVSVDSAQDYSAIGYSIGAVVLFSAVAPAVFALAYSQGYVGQCVGRLTLPALSSPA